MLHTSTRKLIDRLSEMTELGKLDWTETDDGNIAYATEGYSVTLTEEPNEVIITSKDGKELERATTEEIAATESEDGGSYTSIVAAMTKEAARVARGTEAAISTLLAGMEDAPVDVTEDATAEEAASLQEDLGDETAILASESVETLAQETTIEETDAEPASEPTEAVVEDDQIDESDEPAAVAMEAADDVVETEVTDAESEAGSMADIESAAEIDVTLDEDVAPESLDETDPDPVLSMSEPDTTEAIESEPETPAEIEMTSEDEPAISTESESETADAPESESDVTEAVVRLADEVNNREDENNGLEIAAASAVGAVAAAAGLAATDSDDAPETIAEDAAEVVETTAATIETEPSPEPPAYVPFGLSESEPETTETDLETEAPAEETVAFEAAAPIVDDAVEPEDSNEVETMDASEAPVSEPLEVETVEESAPEPISTFTTMTETEPEDIAEAASEPNDAATFGMDESAEPDIEPHAPEPVLATAPDVEPAPDSVEAPEPVLETVAAAEAPTESAPSESPAPESYSLSGIGAGFGLGALSAKTEASGIPGPSSSVSDATEKVVIDATDDVLPKLEGNLNASLAETASAAVSHAKLETVTAGSAEEPAESESDILKPRTRFNPWD